MEADPKIRIELTPEQRRQIQRATGQDVAIIELTAEALEKRVTPIAWGGPTMLAM